MSMEINWSSLSRESSVILFLFISTRKKKNLAELRDGRELRDNSELAKISRLPIPESLIRRQRDCLDAHNF